MGGAERELILLRAKRVRAVNTQKVKEEEKIKLSSSPLLFLSSSFHLSTSAFNLLFCETFISKTKERWRKSRFFSFAVRLLSHRWRIFKLIADEGGERELFNGLRHPDNLSSHSTCCLANSLKPFFSSAIIKKSFIYCDRNLTESERNWVERRSQ